jgi:hypothetical protein
MNINSRLAKLEKRANEGPAQEIRTIRLVRSYPGGMTVTEIYNRCWQALGAVLYAISGQPCTAEEAEQHIKGLSQ